MANKLSLRLWGEFERLLSLCVGLALLPVIGFIAIWIRVDTPGSALFRQVRLGKDGRPFTICKFRTMYANVDRELPQERRRVIEADDDPRVTRAGRFLRRTSLDELPQLWNLFRGDMALVGPRPILPEQQRAMPSWGQERFHVKPGVTGLAQVRGRRSLNWLDQLRWDCEFACHDSVRLRLRIIFQTFRTLFKDSVYGTSTDNWRSYLPENTADADD